MAGAKGKSGGYREGAGRKRAPRDEVEIAAENVKHVAASIERQAGPRLPADAGGVDVGSMGLCTRNALDFLLDVMQDDSEEKPLRVRAAIAAVQYTHTKRADGGKKDEAEERAKKVAAEGKFQPRPVPQALKRVV